MWAKEAPILTQSRIDVPKGGSRLAAGPNAIAGVAWAPDRGISAVEVRIECTGFAHVGEPVHDPGRSHEVDDAVRAGRPAD